MTEFFAMGGYGGFVWGSYGVTALFMVVELVLVVRRRRSLIQRLLRMRRLSLSMKRDKVSDETQT